MGTEIIAIGNQKGGVGKTTTAVNLSVALARSGVSTLLVDLDPQSNATSSLGYEKEAGKSIYRALLGEEKATTKVMQTGEKNLSIIPGEVDLAAVESELQGRKDYLLQLRRCLAPIVNSGAFSAIVLDCPPAIGMLSMNAMSAATQLVVTLQCEYLALEGIAQIMNTYEQIKESINPELNFGGVVMTMYDVRTKLSVLVVNEVKEHLGEYIFKTFIPRSIRLAEAPSHGKSIFEYDPISSGAVAYKSLGKEVMKRFNLKK